MEVHINELQHHGTKGMRWGVRRYQNKDGSLTKAGEKRYNKEMDRLKTEKKTLRNQERTRKKLDKLEKMKSDVDNLKKGVDRDESPEQKRERLFKSTDPKEIYENRNLLTTNELNERITRIDMENRLQSKIVEEHAKTGMEIFNEKSQKVSNTIDNATKTFKSIDNAYSSVANSAIGKTLAKQLGLEVPKKEFDLDEFWKNRNKKTTQEIMDVDKRLMAEERIRKKINPDQSDKDTKNQSKKKTETKENTNKDSSDTYRYETTGKDVFGEGTSRFSGFDSNYTQETVYDGQRYVDRLLQIEDKRRK